jgi:hypothetical protein
MPPNSGCGEVRDSPPRNVSGPNCTRVLLRGSNAAIGRAAISILTGASG